MNVLRQNHNGNIKVFPVDDTMCMSYCTNLGKVLNHKLDTLAQTELNYTTIKYEDLCGKGANQKTFDLINPLEALNYAAEDSDVALALYKNLKLRLMSDKKNFVYQKLERELISVLSDIEVNRNNPARIMANVLNFFITFYFLNFNSQSIAAVTA